MDKQVQHALATGRTIDITAYGRRSGQPRRIETWFHNLDGAIYMTGTPGKRDWYANLVANPEFIFHLKEQVSADLPARATPVTDPDERRAVLSRILARLDRSDQIEEWVRESPLVLVTFEDRKSTRLN